MKNSSKFLVTLIASLITIAPGTGNAIGPSTLGRDMNRAKQLYLPTAKRIAAPFASIIFCRQYPDECTSPRSRVHDYRMTLSAKRLAELREVNNAVNKAIRPVNDTGDTWSLEPSSGDCEDYAITKRHLLIAKGWSPRAVRLAIAYTAFGEGHMVAVVKTDKGDLVLDNRNAAIREWNKTGLRWVMMQSADSPARWVEITTRLM